MYFISIDCGAPNDYDDYGLGVYYKTDDKFIDSGENRQISTQHIYEYKEQRSKNLRVFPNGTRNCYTLQPDKGKGNKYLIRATFYYGNYDSKDQQPVFDLHIGTDYWDTVNSTDFFYTEVIHIPKTDDIQVCLVNTGNGFPFISSLELRWLDSSIYQVNFATSLLTKWRYDIGSSATYRFPQDAYDRIWSGKNYDFVPLNIRETTSLSNNNDAYKVPAEVLQTALSTSDVNSPISLYWNSNSNYTWVIYFHFAELKDFPSGQLREFNITVNGNFLKNVTLEYLKPVTVASDFVSGSKINFTIQAIQQSGKLPPILNAIELFTIIKHLSTPTALDDITAINEIKKVYTIKRVSWQGDPCVPTNFTWEGVECSYEGSPRITAL
ncbi:hypothetical protein SAY86_018893 [Trapa natans]|uniref:Malectin-like domain-containing protein n=1 Tax=Trapa natans TaxID=22666 RepID=A0AAN7LNN7_TRANT|nr:hypothetical protein SAY86_018893 [Trapa natans]